jgi:hypothetical protein
VGPERGHEFNDEQVHEIARRVQAKTTRDPSAEWKTAEP